MECVPNFSEGRDLQKIDKIVAPFRGKQGVKLLDYSNDEDHNRLVVTVVGEPEPRSYRRGGRADRPQSPSGTASSYGCCRCSTFYPHPECDDGRSRCPLQRSGQGGCKTL